MSREDDDQIDLTRPRFLRGQLRELEMRSIAASFDAVRTVVRMVNDGKEATVYLCETDDGFAAAKMFRAEKFRGFRNAKTYLNTEGMRDRRAAKAIRHGTRRGREITHHLWVEREWSALERLHLAGASVPEPYAKTEAGILMEYLGDEDAAAPNLIEAHLDRVAAAAAWESLRWDLECMLELGLIHGDLSGYNVLYWQDRARVIDLPQALEARALASGFDMLVRDVSNVTQPLLRAGLDIDPLRVSIELAQRYL